LNGLGHATVFAPAKVNPSLIVLGKRPDGYHEVDTTLVALDLGDRLTLSVVPEAGPDIALTVSGPLASADVPRDGRNLAVRALVAARDLLVAEVPSLAAARLELHLEKHVPSQAGLGGGSSDAAAAVRALEVAVGARIAPAARAALLARLGADCAFFGAAEATGAGRARGFGESVAPLPAPRAWSVVVVTPSAVCPTGSIYAALQFPLEAAPEVDLAELLTRPADAARAALFNHLERAALRAVPALAPWRALFDDLARTEDPRAGTFRLSGSGSSWFTLVAGRAEGAALLDRVRAGARRRALDLRGAWVTQPAGPYGLRPCA